MKIKKIIWQRNRKVSVDEIVNTLDDLFLKVCENCDRDITNKCGECIFLTALKSYCKAVEEGYANE